MSYHVSNLGVYGPVECADMDGYVPEATDGPWDLRYDHGSESTHNEDGTLTEYGEWWRGEGWADVLSQAMEATREAEESLSRWQSS